jgi:hypothetical protein
MTTIPGESERVGLCFSCEHVRIVRTDRGSAFYLCQRSATDPRFPKYPGLPVVRCPGFEVKEAAGDSPNM